MFERFTDRARHVVVHAQEEARLLRHNYIGTEHILLGLLHGDGIAAKALGQLGVEADDVRAAVVAADVGDGPGAVTNMLPFTPRAKQVMEGGLKQALKWGHNYIGTEHLLAGLVEDDGSLAVKILRERGVTADIVRRTVLELLLAYVSPVPVDTSETATEIDDAAITGALASPECPSCGAALAGNLAADVIPTVGPVDRVFVVAYCSGCGHTLSVLPDD